MTRLLLFFCLLTTPTTWLPSPVSTPPSSVPSPPRTYAPLSHYKRSQVSGWTLYVHRDYYKPGKQKLKQLVVRIVHRQLAAAQYVLPPHALKVLRQVSVFLEYTPRCKGNSAVFRMGAPAAFRQRGLHPRKAKAIELCGAKIVFDTVFTMPAQLLHELAHAYHSLAVTATRARLIKRAYQNALKQGLYRKVKMYKAPAKRAYALHSLREYFAETSESFFARNNAFPFHREELRRYDPVGYQMMLDVWGVVYTPPPYPIKYGYDSYKVRATKVLK